MHGGGRQGRRACRRGTARRRTVTEGTSGIPMYTIRLASSSDGRSGGGPIRTPSTCVTPLAAAMRSSEVPSPAAMREPRVGARRGAGTNAAAAIVSSIIPLLSSAVLLLWWEVPAGQRRFLLSCGTMKVGEDEVGEGKLGGELPARYT